jgi:hypothetical protein
MQQRQRIQSAGVWQHEGVGGQTVKLEEGKAALAVIGAYSLDCRKFASL